MRIMRILDLDFNLEGKTKIDDAIIIRFREMSSSYVHLDGREKKTWSRQCRIARITRRSELGKCRLGTQHLVILFFIAKGGLPLQLTAIWCIIMTNKEAKGAREGIKAPRALIKSSR